MNWPPQRRNGIPLDRTDWGTRTAAYTCSVCGQAGEVQVNLYYPAALRAHPGCENLTSWIGLARQAGSPEQAARRRNAIAFLWADSTDPDVTPFQRDLARQYLAEASPEPGR